MQKNNEEKSSPLTKGITVKKQTSRKSNSLVLDHAQTISALVIILANKMTGSSSALYRREFDLGTTEWRIMALLAIQPWITPQYICKEIGFDKAVISRAIKRLESGGLVVIRPNPVASRSFELALTNKGFSLHDKVVKVALERERRLMSGLTQQEIDQMLTTLKKLLDTMPKVNEPIEFSER